MTPTTLHPSAVRQRAVRDARADLTGGASPDARRIPFPDDERTEVLASPGPDGYTAADDVRHLGPLTADGAAADAGGRGLPRWFLAFLVAAFVAVLAGTLVGVLNRTHTDAAVGATPDRALYAPDTFPTATASTGPDRDGGQAGAAGNGAGNARGGAAHGATAAPTDATDPGAGTDPGGAADGTSDGAGSGTDAGTDGTDPADATSTGVLTLLKPTTATRFAGSAIALEVEAVLPGHDEPVPGEDVHWVVERDGAVVHETWGLTATVPAGTVLAGSYHVTVCVDSDDVLGQREVSFTVAAKPALTLDAVPTPVVTVVPTLSTDLVATVPDL